MSKQILKKKLSPKALLFLFILLAGLLAALILSGRSQNINEDAAFYPADGNIRRGTSYTVPTPSSACGYWYELCKKFRGVACTAYETCENKQGTEAPDNVPSGNPTSKPSRFNN